MERFNEVILYLLVVHLLCFSNYIDDRDLQFKIGYGFILLLGILFLVNIGNMAV